MQARNSMSSGGIGEEQHSHAGRTSIERPQPAGSGWYRLGSSGETLFSIGRNRYAIRQPYRSNHGRPQRLHDEDQSLLSGAGGIDQAQRQGGNVDRWWWAWLSLRLWTVQTLLWTWIVLPAVNTFQAAKTRWKRRERNLGRVVREARTQGIWAGETAEEEEDEAAQVENTSSARSCAISGRKVVVFRGRAISMQVLLLMGSALTGLSMWALLVWIVPGHRVDMFGSMQRLWPSSLATSHVPPGSPTPSAAQDGTPVRLPPNMDNEGSLQETEPLLLGHTTMKTDTEGMDGPSRDTLFGGLGPWLWSMGTSMFGEHNPSHQKTETEVPSKSKHRHHHHHHHKHQHIHLSQAGNSANAMSETEQQAQGEHSASSPPPATKWLRPPLCTLDQVTLHGRWVPISQLSEAEQWSAGGFTSLQTPPHGAAGWKDAFRLRYGPKGCRRHIWNERYLLDPMAGATTTPIGQTDPAATGHAQSHWTLAGTSSSSSSPSQKWIDVFLGSTKVWVTDQVISTERHLVEMERETAGAAAKSEGHGGGSSDGEDDDSGGGASEGAMCLRPTVDIQEWISLLQDSPLLMVGDKFLEQEYLTIECMLLGAQDALEQRVEAVRVEPATEKDKEEESKGTATKADEEEGGQSRDNDDEDDDEPIQVEKRGSSDNGQSPLPFKIESEMPPFVELKVRPSSVSSLTPGSSAITSEGNEDGTKGGQARSKIYRKAKPGVMKLIDRVSNLTLVTFVRSDLLWDPQLEDEDDDQDESSASEEGVEEQGDAQDESAPYSDHSPLKKNSHRDGKEGATKGAKGKKGSFHPDCQWIESVLMCEPSSRVSHEILERLKEERQSAKDASTVEEKGSNGWKWWYWLVSDVPVVASDTATSSPPSEDGAAQTPTIQEQGQQSKNSAATMESWLGSDFDHEMIRLCWIDELKQLAEPDARSADISDPQQDEPFSSSSAVDTGAARTPTVVFSYGYHWRQRPRLVDRYLFDTSSKTSPQRFQHNDYHLEDSGGNKGSDGSASARRRSSLLPRDDNSGGTSSINFISRLQLISLLSFTSTKHNREREMQFVEERRRRREALRIGYATMLHKSVQYVTDNYPESHIIVQTSLERRHWEDDEQHGEKEKVESEAPANAMDHSKRSSTLDARKGRKSCSTRELTRQEMLSVEDDDIALTAISKNVVKSFQDPAVTLLDTYFLSQWTPDQSPEAVATSGRDMHDYPMPGPLDAMVEMIYGEQFRQRYNDEQEDADEL